MFQMHTARVAPEKTMYSARPAAMLFAESFGESKMQMTYWEQLKHPEWQRKRLEMLSIADFACQNCGSKENTLHVHHKQYFKGRMAWEYSEDELEVLCDGCHKDTHHSIDGIKEILSLIDTHEAYAVLCGYFSHSGMLEPGRIEEGRQTYALAFAAAFTGSLLMHLDIEDMHKVAKFAVSLTKPHSEARPIFDGSQHNFGKD